MLIEQRFKNNDYVSIKLNTSEELLGKLVDTRPDVYVLTSPFVIAVMNTPQGQQIGLRPYMILGEMKQKVDIGKSFVVSIIKVEPTNQLVQQYIQATTGLTTASSLAGLEI